MATVELFVRSTDARDSLGFLHVVDCQWACPAHTPVPEYIRLVAQGRYDEAYLLNWQANVFPGILGRICDRPCETACRRGRVEQGNTDQPSPVAICRIKRVAADFSAREIPAMTPARSNGKRIACVGGGPASLTVARDLAPLGYEVTVFDGQQAAGGFMRSAVPRFRLPESVIDEEVGHVMALGAQFHGSWQIESMAGLMRADYDAIFVGCGAPRGRDLELPGRSAAAEHIHLGLDWLASVHFGHITTAGRRVIVLGGGNTAMDCCRTALRMGASEVSSIVRSGFEEMKASPWEKDDAIEEGVSILNYMVPRAFEHEQGQLTGITFSKVQAVYDDQGRRSLVPTGEPDVTMPCDEVLIAIGQENAFPWIERDIGIAFHDNGLPVVDALTMQSSVPRVFFGGDAAFGPGNIITAVAHGHAAAISIDKYLHHEDVCDRPPIKTTLLSQKMGIHDWSYRNEVSSEMRFPVRWEPHVKRLGSLHIEAELGFDSKIAVEEASRCLNCDVQTIFSASLCIECDACMDICPMDCITFTQPAEETVLRTQLKAPADNLTQTLLVSDALGTGQIMVKDEDVCLHCAFCAERCPSGAWDMQKVVLDMPYAGPDCRSRITQRKTA